MGQLGAALPRTVVILGLVSLLNDAASEMITPLLPIFLTAALGAGPAIVGLVEGLAEATASILKLVSGRLADRGVPAKSLVVGGCTLSNAMRPLIGLATGWGAVLGLRFLDRVGKGIRSAPRDALIAGAAGPEQSGRAFGFHRSMDHAGSVIGPLLAFALLAAHADLKHVFLASAVPGVLVILMLVFGLPRAGAQAVPTPPRFAWGELHGRLKAMIIAAGLLALASVPEVFVVLWATQAGLKVVWVLFMAYSATLPVTEPAERSVIGDHAAPEERGTAFGLYHLASGLLVLPGAVIFGLIWQRFGSTSAFTVSAVVTAAAALLMISLAGSRGSGARHVP